MKITLKAFLVVGLMALVFLVLFSWLASKSKISALESIAKAA